MKQKILIAICLLVCVSFGLAQAPTSNSAKVEFERGFEQSSTPVKTPPRGSSGPAPTRRRPPDRSVGRSGMKVWFQRQIGCDGKKPFLTVAPTTAFFTGDCVRVKFMLNFAGYLTIVNLGTSGKRMTIFPDENQSNLISPKTEYVLPKTGSWKFQGDPGNEQLIFIVSKSPLKDTDVEKPAEESLITEKSPDFEVLDRDIVPVAENNEVYVLADETKIKDVIVFRIRLKHRGRN